MNPPIPMNEHGRSRALRRTALCAEELANCLTHGLGAVLSMVGCLFLLQCSSECGTDLHVFSCGIYGFSLVALYTASTLYHGTPAGALKQRLRRLDHICIYLLIAGTYTPFSLIGLSGPAGWKLLAVIWSLAAAGVLLKLITTADCLDRSLSILLCGGMGWMVLTAVQPLTETISAAGVLWLVAGGACYTSGLFFFLQEGKRYHHAIWHLFVLAGSACHYCSIAVYVVPVSI